MIIESVNDLQALDFSKYSPMPRAMKVLMVKADHFKVEYAINPYMKDSSGKLQVVDHSLALSQWNSLKKQYGEIGLEVQELEGAKDLPDMVFCANTSFPFVKNNEKHVIISNMNSDHRKDEVKYLEKFYAELGYQIHHLNKDHSFEANGDALIHNKWILGGHGFRTDKAVYREITKLTDLPVIALELISDKFYHLDTCLSILNEDSIAIVREGFSESSIKVLETLYKNVIEIDLDEALNSFAANCHCPDSKNVLVHGNCPKFCSKLESNGFKIHPLDTSEFMKSGGSVFCMKMMFY